MKLIDSHVHFWDPINTPRKVSILNKFFGFSPKLEDQIAKLIFPRSAYQFFGSPQYIIRSYLPSDYERDCGYHDVNGVIHIEAGWEERGPLGSVGETKWLESLNSGSNPKILGVIVNASLALGNRVDSILRAHLEASNLVKGAREQLFWQPNKRIMNGCKMKGRINDPEWRKGFEILSNYDLSFEATIYDGQIDDLTELARDYPNMNIMLSHLGTPIAVGGEFGGNGKTKTERNKTIQSWKDKMSRLAENKNVFVKLSGLAMPVCGFSWHKRSHAPSVEHVAESFSEFIIHAVKVFGHNRCLFGSNYPIDKVSLPLNTLIDAYKIVLSELTEDECQRIFYQNALTFYRINPEKT